MCTCTSCYLAGVLDVALFQWGDIFRPSEPSVWSAAGEYCVLLVHWMLYIIEYIPLSKITHWCTASQTSDACNTDSPSSDACNMHLFLPKSKQPLTKWKIRPLDPQSMQSDFLFWVALPNLKPQLHLSPTNKLGINLCHSAGSNQHRNLGLNLGPILSQLCSQEPG